MFIDTDQLIAEIKLMAENNGDAYEDGRNAAQAVRTAYRAACNQARRAIREAYKEHEAALVAELKARWESPE